MGAEAIGPDDDPLFRPQEVGPVAVEPHADARPGQPVALDEGEERVREFAVGELGWLLRELDHLGAAAARIALNCSQ